jgi:plastin-3
VLQIDKNGDGYIDLSELKEALDGCGFKLPGWKVRQIIEEYDDKRQIQHRGRLSFDEFEKVFLVLLCKYLFNPYTYIKSYFCCCEAT